MSKPVVHKNKSGDYEKARELRRDSSPFEQKLWKELQHLYKATGIKFRRQQPFSPCIADFACMEARLIVELDGSSHDARQEYDQKRDDYLLGLGYEVLRFNNDELKTNLDGFVATIAFKAKELTK